LPYYLLDDASKKHLSLSLIREAAHINEVQPGKIAGLAFDILKFKNKSVSQPKILISGIAYKANISDIRQSTALRLWQSLEEKGASVTYHDPLVPKYNGTSSWNLTQNNLLQHDLVIIATAHEVIDYQTIVSAKVPILDTRNILKEYNEPHIYRL
jgi:UDP-N-acetyl-D-glucosamine dehydrogenase